jgi:hypothetical protein
MCSLDFRTRIATPVTPPKTGPRTLSQTCNFNKRGDFAPLGIRSVIGLSTISVDKSVDGSQRTHVMWLKFA